MKRYLALVLATITIFSLTGCGSKNVEEKKEESIAVSVQAVNSGEIKNTNTFTGTAKAKDETNVSVEIGGTVENVNVELGQKVNAGDTLLTIKDDDVQDGIKTARAAVESAQANSESNVEQTKISSEKALKDAQLAYDEAKRNYEIKTQLYNADAISEDDYKQVEKGYNQAKQALDSAIKSYDELLPIVEESGRKQVEQAQASYDVQMRNIDKITLTSPVNGVITAKKCNKNEQIGQGQVAFTISSSDILQIDLLVTANDIGKFTVGHKVKVTIGDEETQGTIQSVPEVIGNTASFYTVEVIVDNSNGKFKSGSAAEVEVSIEQQDNAINIPKKAVFEDEGKKYVYIVTKDKKAKKVEVQTGIETENRVEIKSGISASDTVVIEGLSLIGDGTKLFTVEKED